MAKSKATASGKPQEWTPVGFLDEFMRVDEQMEDRAFAFLLGAGASVTSVIPAAGALARDWVQELYRLEVGDGDGIALERKKVVRRATSGPGLHIIRSDLLIVA